MDLHKFDKKAKRFNVTDSEEILINLAPKGVFVCCFHKLLAATKYFTSHTYKKQKFENEVDNAKNYYVGISVYINEDIILKFPFLEKYKHPNYSSSNPSQFILELPNEIIINFRNKSDILVEKLNLMINN